jgi:type II secretory pathway component PulC
MKFINALILAVVVVGLMYAVINLKGEEIVYEQNETLEVETPVEEVEKEDVIERARLELERINTELDAKEQELLEQRKAIDVELEKLRQTRVSFQ